MATTQNISVAIGLEELAFVQRMAQQEGERIGVHIPRHSRKDGAGG